MNVSIFGKVRTGILLLTASQRERLRAVYRNKLFDTPIHRNILLAGSPRSGTTWVGNILGCLPGYIRINEPFSPATPGLAEAGFSWNTAKSPDDMWEGGLSILHEVLSGKRFHPQALDDNTFLQVLFSRAAVLKVVRGNRLLPWLARNFRFGCIFHLVRHPCAVVSSQVSHPLFPAYETALPEDLTFVDAYMPHLSEYSRSISDEMEARAFTWALDQCFPLLFEKERHWSAIRYENLVADGESELSRAFTGTNLKTTGRMRRELHKASKESHEWSANHSGVDAEERLGGWRKRLASKEVNKILSVVEKVGIEGFSAEPAPDYRNFKFTGRCLLEASHSVSNVA